MDNKLIAGITTIASAPLGAITVATVPMVVTSTVPAAGVAGWLGVTTTISTVVAAPVTLPVGGIIATGALLTYGYYKVHKLLNEKNNNSDEETDDRDLDA